MYTSCSFAKSCCQKLSLTIFLMPFSCKNNDEYLLSTKSKIHVFRLHILCPVKQLDITHSGSFRKRHVLNDYIETIIVGILPI